MESINQRLKSEHPDIINFGGGETSDISKVFNYNDYENNGSITSSVFSNNNIIEKSKDLIYSYHSKSVESIYTLKTHALFPTLENINNYLMNRTN